MKLINIVKSEKEGKKLKATFEMDNGRTKSTHFGASGMSDFTIHKDLERRERYRQRHEKDLKTNDPTRAGFLSYYILWGESTSLRTNIANYKKKFNL